jgi:hypothetical protein
LDRLHRDASKLALDVAGTKSGTIWKHVAEWAWAELEWRKHGPTDAEEQLTNGAEVKP